MENGTVVIRKNGRKWVKISNSNWEVNAVHVAKQNPDICGKWFAGCEVHHIDGDKTNDNPRNLICLSKDEHHKIHKEIKKHIGISVIAYKNGEYYNSYETLTICSKDIGIPIPYISMYLKQGRFPKGKYDCSEWSFKLLN